MSEQNNRIKIRCTESQATFIKECGCIATNHDDFEDCCHCDICPYDVDNVEFEIIYEGEIPYDNSKRSS